MPFQRRNVLRMTGLLLAGSLVLTAPLPAQARRKTGCADRTNRVRSTNGRLGLPGIYSLPRRKPRAMVVFAHGYRKPASVYWRGHLRRAAKKGVLAAAMDYRGIGGAPDYRGWNVRAGAADSIAAAKHFWARCRTIRTVILVGVSMGGNTAGLVLAAQPTRAARPGSPAAGAPCPCTEPLFDHWISIEGALNVTETYLEATAAEPTSPYVAGAKQDIEREMGGTIADVPDRYREATVVARADDVAASGVKSVTIVHGLEDGLVPYDQSREMAEALRIRRIPLDVFTVLGRGEGEDGTVLSGYALGGTGWESPFAGHGGEEDRTHMVIRTGLDRLWAVLGGAQVGPDREFVADGTLGVHPAP